MSETSAPAEELLADVEEAMRDVVDPSWGSTSLTWAWSTAWTCKTVTKGPSR